MISENVKLWEKVKEFYRAHKPSVVFFAILLVIFLYKNDNFRSTFTSIAQICTAVGAIVALVNNINLLEKQNQLQEYQIKIKKYRSDFVKKIEVNKIPKAEDETYLRLLKVSSNVKEILINDIYNGKYDNELEELYSK